jgi:acyl carrier protein
VLSTPDRKTDPSPLGWLRRVLGRAGAKEAADPRTLLSDEAFYDRYFADRSVEKSVAIMTRRLFKECVPFEQRRLRRAEPIASELHFPWAHDSMRGVELLCTMERKFQIVISDDEARQIPTLGDVIRLVDSKVKEKLPR